MGYLKDWSRKSNKAVGTGTTNVFTGGLSSVAIDPKGALSSNTAKGAFSGGIVGAGLGAYNDSKKSEGGIFGKTPIDGAFKDDPKVNTAGAIPDPTLSAYSSAMSDPANSYTAGTLDTAKNALDMSGINAIKGRAMMQGDSPWARMALEKQGMEQKGLMSQSAAMQANQAAQARAAAGARGGLRGGAGLRLSNQSANNAALAGQGVLQQGALSRATIGMQDQQMKDQFLSQLPGAQLGAAQYNLGMDQFNVGQQNQGNQFNIANRIADNQGLNQHNQLTYTEQMKRKAGATLADAIQNSSARSAWSKVADPAGMFG